MILDGTVYRKCENIAIPCFTTKELQRIHTLLSILEAKRSAFTKTDRYEQKITLGKDNLECKYLTSEDSSDIVYQISRWAFPGKPGSFLYSIFEVKRVFSSEGEYFIVSTFHDGPWLDQLFKENEFTDPFSPTCL